MAAGADKTVRILNEHQLPWADLPGPAAEDQQRLLGPPLRDPETGMALLEFDCGPARAAPVVQQPALLLDHMAPLPELPAVDGIYSSAAFVPADSVRHIALRAGLQCQAAYNLSWQADSACARVFSVSDAWFNSPPFFLACRVRDTGPTAEAQRGRETQPGTQRYRGRSTGTVGACVHACVGRR